MINKKSRNEMRKVRHTRVRKQISGTSLIPRLNVYRSNKNISQEKLAYAIDVDRTYISALEQGNKIASVYCLYKLSQELNINFKDLFDFTL